MAGWTKLGVIAGQGDLPVAIAEHLQAEGRDYFVARIAALAEPALAMHPGADTNLGAVGMRLAALKDAGCDAVTFAGRVPRPDFATLQLDDVARAMMPVMLAAAAKGDDALLRVLVQAHIDAGFRIVGPEEVLGDLKASAGVYGAHAPDAAARADMIKAAHVAAAIGVLDVAQGVVVCDGLVLSIEAAEGTDAMLRRTAELPAAIRGTPARRRGVLVKRPKPIQERRIDLPAIGVRTIEGAAAAGLAGVAIEAGGALVVRRDAVVAVADRLGLFVYGFTADDVDTP